MADTKTPFPPNNVLPLGPDGRFSRVWLDFFVAVFRRTGAETGFDPSGLQAAITALIGSVRSLEAEAESAPLAAAFLDVFAAGIAQLEAQAAQGVTVTTHPQDERGEAGEGASIAHLSQRIADLEGQLEGRRADDSLLDRIADLEANFAAICAQPFTDNSQLTNGAGYLVAASNLSDVSSASTAASNLGLGTLNSPTFAGMGSTGPVSAVAPVSGSYAATFAANSVPTQNVAIGGDATVNRVDSFSPASAAKLLSFNSTTTSGNTTPTGGAVGMRWMVLGVIKMFLNQAGRFLIGTTTDDGSGNLLQVASGLSITPTTTTTAPTAGGAGALPATPTGYATIRIGGTDRKVAYY